MDGNGFTITNKNPQKTNIAIFSSLEGATILNLRYKSEAKVVEEYEWYNAPVSNIRRGGIADIANNSSLINCISTVNYTIKKTVSLFNVSLGGLIGYAENCNITDCIVLNSTLYIEIKKLGQLGNIGTVGGLIGEINNTTINNCTIINGEISSGGDTVNDDFAGNAGNDNNIQDNNTNAGTDIPEKEVDDILNNNGSGGGDSGTTEPITLLTVDLSKATSPDATKITVVNNNGSLLISNVDPKITQKIILKNNTNSPKLDLSKYNGDVICSNNSVEKLIVGPKVKLGGNITTTSVELHDGCHIAENGINNSGEIRYFRKPQVYVELGDNNKTKPGGWETICLPFEAEVFIIKNEEEIQQIPFDDINNNASFWLKEYDDYQGEKVYFKQAIGKLNANIPYIIAFPGGTNWGKFDLKPYKILYKGWGAIAKENIDKTQIYSGNSYSLRESTTCYFLDTPSESDKSQIVGIGNKFIYQKNVVNKAFRASVNLPSSASMSPQIMKIGFSANNATELPSLILETQFIYAHNGEIIIESDKNEYINIYHGITGRIIKNIHINPGKNIVTDLPKGIYIIKGKKVIL